MDYDYNTSRTHLVLPEYGRNIQKMVEYTKGIESREERNKAAQTIITVMGNMNPHLRDTEDFKHKLWDHLAIMSNFELDIDFPYEIPTAALLEEKPRSIPYNHYIIKFKHYGKIVEMFIDRAVDMEDGPEKNAFIAMIGNHMKKSYVTWNRENVSDPVIFNDMEQISKGRLKVPEGIKLMDPKEFIPKPQSGGRKKKTLRKIK